MDAVKQSVWMEDPIFKLRVQNACTIAAGMAANTTLVDGTPQPGAPLGPKAIAMLASDAVRVALHIEAALVQSASQPADDPMGDDARRNAAQRHARTLLQNLVHYTAGRSYEDADRNRIAEALQQFAQEVGRG